MSETCDETVNPDEENTEMQKELKIKPYAPTL